MARRAKEWFDREKRIMAGLGLTPTPRSGSGFEHKEDGASDTLIAQLKSTDGQSISVTRRVLKDLFYHAYLSHKKGLLVLDFVDGDLIVCCRARDLKYVAEHLGKEEGKDEDDI